jgi:flavin reductase (DIM6/NTAB) family NADH-FMN oxidoreductase RutF
MSTNVSALFRSLTYGVYVIGVAHGGRRNAFTAAWVMQAAFDPLLLALSINTRHASYPLLRDGRVFSVSVLRQGQLDLARHFGTTSGREVDKLAGYRWRTAVTGAPILEDALAYFDCRTSYTCHASDHELILGHVVDGAILTPEATPLHYAGTDDLDGSSALYPATLDHSTGHA